MALALATAIGMLQTTLYPKSDAATDNPSASVYPLVPTIKECREIQSNSSSFDSFGQFYPFYLCEHSHPITKLFHFVATFNVVMIVAGLVAAGRQHNVADKDAGGNAGSSSVAKHLLFAMVQAYSWAWLSHYWIEMNKPATFNFPLSSFLADFNMFADYLTLKIPPYWSYSS